MTIDVSSLLIGQDLVAKKGKERDGEKVEKNVRVKQNKQQGYINRGNPCQGVPDFDAEILDNHHH